MPQPLAPISPENADRVTQLARWGKGGVSGMAYSPDGTVLVVASSQRSPFGAEMSPQGFAG